MVSSLVCLILPLLYIAIDSAFHKQLLESVQEQLEVYSFDIIAGIEYKDVPNNVDEFDLEYQDGGLRMPEQLTIPKLNQLNSGVYATITSKTGITVWRSTSALEITLPFAPEVKKQGEAQFKPILDEGFAGYVYSYQLEFETKNGWVPLAVHLYLDQDKLRPREQKFRKTLLLWLGILVGLIFIQLIIWLIWLLRPLKTLDQNIKEVEQGKRSHIEGAFPIELDRLRDDLNLLLASIERQKKRYRDYLSDMAHALKTPLAVLKTSEHCNEPAMQEPIDRIQSIIEHQLKRAGSGGFEVWRKNVEVEPITRKITNAMDKIYRDKGIDLQVDIPEKTLFRGDDSDLMEILGNLIDNACKACKSQVRVSAKQNNKLVIIVEDDGPGVSSDKVQRLFERGKRLDTYEEGHGVGLSIVHDLVHSYNGNIHVSASESLQGAQFEITL
ncbi:ATP-binding protein [Algicola sagamiensis]|uniref:ATP-binding protein n=1 Tax=Algicola sagamiensis TaxID=163869 RepID=UPI0003A4D131|nr:ATP-binding protein [Algicola sagamiensis]